MHTSTPAKVLLVPSIDPRNSLSMFFFSKANVVVVAAESSSEGWPLHGQSSTIVFCLRQTSADNVLLAQSTQWRCHAVILQLVFGLPLRLWPGVVPCIISFFIQLPSFRNANVGLHNYCIRAKMISYERQTETWTYELRWCCELRHCENTGRSLRRRHWLKPVESLK